jgi:hypothetical protein
MVNVRKTVAAAVATLCATVAVIATGSPGASATYLNTCAGNTVPGDWCVNNQSTMTTLFAVPNVATNTLHLGDVVAYVEAYHLPNTSVSVECVVFQLNGTTTDPCANVGLTPSGLLRVPLYQGPVDGATPVIAGTLVTVAICSATLNANYEGVPIKDQPIVVPCADSNLF